MDQNYDNPEFLQPLPIDPPDQDENPLARLSRQLKVLRTNFFLIISPGSKQFRDLSKRLRLMLISFLVPLVFLTMKVFLFEESVQPYLWIGVSWVVSVLAYFGAIWGLKFQIRKESYMSVMNLPPMFAFAMSLFLSLVFLGPLNRVYLLGVFLLVVAIFMAFSYILLLAVNVLNVNLFYMIPLSKLGESMVYLYSVAIAFFMSFSLSWLQLYAINVKDPYLAIFTIVSGIIVLTIMFFSTIYYYTPVQRGGLILSVLLSVILYVLIFVLSLSLSYIILTALVGSLVTFVMLGILIHKTQNTLRFHVYAEYVIVSVIILLSIIFG